MPKRTCSPATAICICAPWIFSSATHGPPGTSPSGSPGPAILP
ncbi:hypothetical protein OV079_09730 [Nannocystis pusilla]|uniref:Uncharacterized protein n=1 Tax=Nannocystis pusilla TaxID=889268 RepID=A0A9X3ESM7_9BACT|nr:hypothetical protein [Nannocystis pusilla]MCY1005841.1 hypothetical protein [Nannocystis pusilla]